MLLVFQFLAQFYHNFFIFHEQNIQCVKSERRTGQGLSTQADHFKAKQVFKNSGRRKCTTICKRLCNVLQIFFQRRAIKLTMMLCIIHPINSQTLEPLLDIENKGIGQYEIKIEDKSIFVRYDKQAVILYSSTLSYERQLIQISKILDMSQIALSNLNIKNSLSQLQRVKTFIHMNSISSTENMNI